MIYRIIGETDRLRWTDEEPPRLVRATGTLMGAMGADFGFDAWKGLPAPKVRINERARFWFTEAGFDSPAPAEEPAPVCGRLAG